MSLQFAWMRLVCGALLLSQLAACGEAPKAAQTAAAATQANAPLLRKPPSLASTIYDVDCQTDADCTLVAQGDVCQCAGWGAMRADNEDKFLQRRARLGARCPDGIAPICTSDPALHAARCVNRQCVASAPRALACVDTVLPNTWPLTVGLGQEPVQTQDEALSMCPASDVVPEGDTQVFLLHPKQAGKYRIVLTDSAAEPNRPHWLVVRTPDCQSDNVACRFCQDGTERCLIDEVLGPDDTAVIVVRNCDADCSLQIGQWDRATPLVPPL